MIFSFLSPPPFFFFLPPVFDPVNLPHLPPLLPSPPHCSLPHVAVALREKRAGKSVAPGDFIQYVICDLKDEEGKVLTVSQRARSPEEVFFGI